jgi:hypothetical protein
MSKPGFNNEMMTQYLLGALPEAETERCDELSIADDEFAELLKTTEKDLVDAYVSGELSRSDLQQFDSHYLRSPLRREQVRFAQALQQHGKEAIAPASSVLQSPWAKANRISLREYFGSPRWAWGLAIITLVLSITIGWLALQNLHLRQQMLQTQAKRDELLQREQELQRQIAQQHSAASQTEQQLAQVRAERERLEQELKNSEHQPPGEGRIVSLILAPPLRGAGQISTVSIRPGDKLLAVQLQLEAADFLSYRVSLRDPQSQQTLWRSGPLTSGKKGDGSILRISFPAGLLRPQTYTLRASGVTANGVSEVVSDYPFRVVK